MALLTAQLASMFALKRPLVRGQGLLTSEKCPLSAVSTYARTGAGPQPHPLRGRSLTPLADSTPTSTVDPGSRGRVVHGRVSLSRRGHQASELASSRLGRASVLVGQAPLPALYVLRRPSPDHEHRPLLVYDPDSWAEVALEILHQGLRRAANAAGSWSRRRVALHLCSRMARAVRIHGRRADTELSTDPHVLPSHCREVEDPYSSADPDLAEAIDVALARLAPSTADGLRAAARLEPLTPVAQAHRIDEAALRQRMARARRQLRPQLAGFTRAVS